MPAEIKAKYTNLRHFYSCIPSFCSVNTTSVHPTVPKEQLREIIYGFSTVTTTSLPSTLDAILLQGKYQLYPQFFNFSICFQGALVKLTNATYEPEINIKFITMLCLSISSTSPLFLCCLTSTIRHDIIRTQLCSFFSVF